jgi:sugar-specific transcriptional regulator TrmB
MKEILKQLNFSDKETDIYLASLRMETGTISDLARQAKIKRSTAYVILEKLQEKGLISLSEKSGKQIFISQDPEKLLKLIESEKEELANNEEEIKKMLPQFESLGKKNSAVPLIKYYEGKENMWNIISDMLESRETAWIITPGRFFDIYGKERMMKKVIQRRRQIGNKAYMITDHHPEEVRLWRLEETNVREYRFLPELKSLDTSIFLYGSKVALLFLKEPFNGLIIDNKELFDVFKFMFDSLWRELEGKNLPPPIFTPIEEVE